nr:hypothetical protein [uncultured Bacteroides sp.]
MTTIERKQLLLQRLFAVNDEQQLEAIEAFMNKQCPDGVLYFSSELRDKIDTALNQMQQGQVSTMEEMERRFNQWSGK